MPDRFPYGTVEVINYTRAKLGGGVEAVVEVNEDGGSALGVIHARDARALGIALIAAADESEGKLP